MESCPPDPFLFNAFPDDKLQVFPGQTLSQFSSNFQVTNPEDLCWSPWVDFGPRDAYQRGDYSGTFQREQGLRTALKRVRLTPFKKKFIVDACLRNDPSFSRKLVIKCPARNCDQAFQKVRDAVYHFDDHADEDKNLEFLCPHEKCPWNILGLSSKPSLCRHISSVHGDQSVQCPNCFKVFKRADGLTRHVQKNRCKTARVPPPTPTKTLREIHDDYFDSLAGYTL